MSVGLVIVSHSSKIAEGVVELAAQMAPGVTMIAAGGTEDGGIGTNFDAVFAALSTAQSGSGVVVLCDLGSAIMTAETALEFLGEDLEAPVRIVDAPLVEGAVAAAIEAENDGSLDEVVAAAATARGFDGVPEGDAPSITAADPSAANDDSHGSRSEEAGESVTLTLVNATGLHARPASVLVKAVNGFDAKVTVNGVDAASVLRVMGLGLAQGESVQFRASGPEAAAALDAVTKLVNDGFGE
ncbi:dihydroxyacetone kinase phosphoryl donor subunit DhaM [Humidisolicoccus flavus]|uniref:dihydroxyacetone kinase phosphoryl donor subunit DhaM n=1 Tax=Humidisolicoccus flavus TaxID=3111414 RepID=UPI003248D659